ncbi:hypothetical protein ACEPPN_004726 [Leptodophora sp. 'Broadleaf-Isolate-01']
MSEPTDLTPLQAREIVLDIAEGKGWVEQRIRNKTDPDTLRLLRTIEKIREDLGDAVEKIARDIGSRKARFILEMIQNAEDNKFTKTSKIPSISFEVFPDRIIVECNEDGFILENVQSICRTGRSSKKASRGGYIGEKGIGFKSVFQVASKVHIQSNAFSFSFRYDGGSTSDEKLGIVTPIPEDEVLPRHEWPLTRMTLTTLDSISYDELVDEFNNIPDNLLLFLSTLEELKITIHGRGHTTSVTTFQKTEEAGAGMVKLIKTVENPDDRNASDVTVTQYRIVKRELSDLPIDRVRPDIHECEVVLAFPVENGHPLISPQNVFAFLPIRSFGFSFLIQADFIVEASRQDVVDSPRNKAILNGVAEAFRDAVLEFCSVDSPLRYQWMRYLPATEGRDSFWTVLSSSIVRLLREECILFPYMSSEARKPHQLRILPTTHVDTEGLPLFQDLSDHPMYLLLSYQSTDIKILGEAFGIRKIGDDLMYKRIESDLGNRHSRMMTTQAEDVWHGLAADLIMSMCSRRPYLRERFTTLPLIPLMDGSWASSADQEIYFPSQNGVAIPADLVDTVHPSALKIGSREKLFTELGVLPCSPEFVVERIWNAYLTRGGASDLSSSKAHLSYLYWNNEDIQHPRYHIIWVYDDENKKVTSRRKVIYFQSDHQYSAKQLLKATAHPRNPARTFPACLVPFLHSGYMDLFPTSTRRGEVSWQDWLEKSLGVRHVPRLKSDGGSLSQEFRHIIARQPQMLVGTLKEYWDVYQVDMAAPISHAISQADVVCSGSRTLRKLGSTYMPLPFLKDKVQALGVSRGFPFLEIGVDLEAHNLRRSWIFLEEFGVGFGDDLAFYIEVVRQHENLTQRPWDTTAQENIIKSYEAIADHRTENDTEWLRQVFDDDDVSLILHPKAFSPNSNNPSWTDIRSCVWQGPEDILDREPLALVPQYKNNENISHFFTQVLGIKDANWEDYIRVLSTLKGDSENSTTAQGITEKVLRLYYLLSKVDHVEDQSAIRAIFEEESLVYIPDTDRRWFPPSSCLWDSPVPIDGNAIIVHSYTEDLKGFFVDSLGVSPATLEKLVLELELLAERNPSVEKVKQLIWAINAKKPEKGDLDPLLEAIFLPVNVFDVDSQRFTTVLRSARTDFAIIDNLPIARNFEREQEAKFLDFALEEVLQLDLFLKALNLEDRYISMITYEETACADGGEEDRRLTSKFRERAHELLRCAFFYQSPMAKTDPQSLYHLLLNTSIRRSDEISTKHTLCLGSEDIQVYVPTGYIHIAEEGNFLQVFVPLNNKHRELCYLRNLPQALTILLQIDLSARNIIQKVLTSSVLVLEDLLDAEGVGKIQSVPPPRRNGEQHDDYYDDDEDGEEGEEEVLSHEEATANSPIPTPQSAPLRGRAAVGIWNSPSRSSSPMVHYQDTPAGSQFSESNARVSLSPDRHLSRSPTPEQANFGRSAGYIRLLDHVIRMSIRFVFPHHDTVPQVGNGEIHQGFNHGDAFGVRSQGQMSHDIKIGAAGELFEYLCDMGT